MGIMKKLAVVLILPVLTLASINVEIIASKDGSQRQIHIVGNEVNIISDVERDSFHLHDGDLKEAVNKFLGAKPDAVFLKSPTPWNDLYKTYGWKQITRILKPIRAKMLPVKNTLGLVTRQVFNNTSSKNATYHAHIQQNVEDTIASFWVTSGKLSAGLNISYGFDIKAMSVSGNATMSYISRWGEDVMKSQTVTVGSKVGLDIILQPNQTVIAELFATRAEMQVQIDYEASLYGYIAVYFKAPYKDHNFWGLDINKVLNAGGLNRSIMSSETITLNYYADSEVILRDYDTNELSVKLLR